MYIDAHCDSATRSRSIKTLYRVDSFHLDYKRLAPFMGVQFFAFFFDALKCDNIAGEANCVLSWLKADMERNDDVIAPLLYAEQLTAPQTVLGLIAAEGGELLGGSLEVLRAFYKQGLRCLGLTWNYENSLASGADAAGGVKTFGYDAIAECERLGILLDGAHLNKQSFWDFAKASTKPFIVSHTCCEALFEHRRNLDDEQLRAVADKGGVCGITFARAFLGGEKDLDMLCRHIMHGVSKAGCEHIGIGSDFDGTDLAYGIEGVQDWLKLDGGLKALGLGAYEREKVLGENFRRVLTETLPQQTAY